LCVYSNEITLNFEVSKDIVQEVFYELWNKKESLSHFSNFDAYITRVVKFKSIDYVRSLSKKNKFEAEFINQVSEFDLSNSDFDVEEFEKYILKEIDKLSDIQKKIIQKKSSGLKFRKIASELSLSVRTVEWHMSKIREFLKKSINYYFSHQ
jgi:RNA polymerase sigma-70 factor (ECF subfamily)